MMMIIGRHLARNDGDIFNPYLEVLLKYSSFRAAGLGSARAQARGGGQIRLFNLISHQRYCRHRPISTPFGTLNIGRVSQPSKASRLRWHRAADEPGDAFSVFLLAFAMKAALFPVKFLAARLLHTPRIVVSAMFCRACSPRCGIYAAAGGSWSHACFRSTRAGGLLLIALAAA